MKEITIKDVFNKEKAQEIKTTLDEIKRLINENKILREELEYEKRKHIIK
jgi:cell shape-determining protein MreC